MPVQKLTPHGHEKFGEVILNSFPFLFSDEVPLDKGGGPVDQVAPSIIGALEAANDHATLLIGQFLLAALEWQPNDIPLPIIYCVAYFKVAFADEYHFIYVIQFPKYFFLF
jgi:hypothetical protein